MAHVSPATSREIPYVSVNMQISDILELMASSGKKPNEALLDALDVSKESWTIWDGSTPLGMFGVADSYQPNVGIPWLLATNQLSDIGREFLRGSKWYIDYMHRDYEFLTNYVDLRHTTAQRWLEWLGFYKHKVIQHYGVAAIPFIQYVRTK